MATNWTDEQLKAMEPSNKLTVLSAAAGSGKTTVLVERALRLLLNQDKPVQADKMLIATFSNASAKEFKNRIEKGLALRMKQDPTNNFIKQQRIALQKADISTIHSFCIKLVRENFQTLGIEPDFKICDTPQANLLHSQAISMAMDYGYTLENFKELVSFFGKSSQDQKIREFLQSMHYFFSALPDPLKQAENMLNNYISSTDMTQTQWYKYIVSQLLLMADYLVYLSNQIISLYSLDHFTGYEEGINYVNLHANNLLNAIKNNNLEKTKDLLNYDLPRFGRAKPKCDTSESINNGLYKTFKATITDMKDIIAYLDNQTYISQLQQTTPYIEVLVNVFLRYQENLNILKKEQNAFEFSDFEHMALALLKTTEGKRTPLAITLMNHYEYIMEDEFQDTSFVQDAIFTQIAKDDLANLYVVGDVKQSIYGFRKASPEIFLEKRQIGLDNPSKGNTIFLPHNFRSEVNVIKGINYLFNNIMTKAVGSVDYKDGEYLKSLKQDDNSTPGVQVKIFEKDEANNVAKTIHDMITQGYEIPDKDGMRKVTQKDFCILLRNATNFKQYKEEIENYGHTAFVKDDQLILNKPEVQSVISLLRVVANPLQDVYITATMFGDIFNFSLDEILKIRHLDKNINLYKALALSENPKAQHMLNTLKEFSWASGTLSPDKLIDYICKKTGYYSQLAFTADGATKRENLRWFIAFAKSYAGGNQSSLSGFVHWLDLYIQNGKATDKDDNKIENSVSIMTMHTSKGLEYPICFVCGLGGKFNKTDQQDRLMMDVNLGMSIFSNSKFGYNNSTLGIKATKIKRNNAQADEEMRLLYVALTRAKNLLILTGAYSGNLFTQNTFSKASYLSPTGLPHPYTLQKANTPMEWFLYALSPHPAIANEFEYTKPNALLTNLFDISIQQVQDNEEIQQEELQNVEIDVDITKMKENLKYVYPYQSKTKLPIKMSVSELAKSSHAITLTQPSFTKEKKVTAAEKGTAMHKFIQHCDILLARTNLTNEIIRLETMGLIKPQLLDIEALKTFLNSSMANTILNADEILNEKDFLVPYNAGEALQDETYTKDEILIQGVMDCVIIKDGNVTVIDFKTDYVTSMETLKKRYSAQLNLYRHGAKHLFQTNNVECAIYSFALGQSIVIEENEPLALQI